MELPRSSGWFGTILASGDGGGEAVAAEAARPGEQSDGCGSDQHRFSEDLIGVSFSERVVWWGWCRSPVGWAEQLEWESVGVFEGEP